MATINLATPCPVSAADARYGRQSLYASSDFEDDTANIEYTRVVRQEFVSAKPRRPRRAGKAVDITIFEDVMEDHEVKLGPERKGVSVGKSMLAKPAKRGPMDSQTARPPAVTKQIPSPMQDKQEEWPVTASQTMAQTHRASAKQQTPLDAFRKEPRRRTIFVPSDDTTVLTIHTGANTTRLLDDTFHIAAFTQIQTAREDSIIPPKPTNRLQSKPARRPRMSLAAAPRRMPLQQSPASSNNIPGVDVPGANTGKENLLLFSPAIDMQEVNCKPSVAKPNLQSLRQEIVRSPRQCGADKRTASPKLPPMRSSIIAKKSHQATNIRREQLPSRPSSYLSSAAASMPKRIGNKDSFNRGRNNSRSDHIENGFQQRVQKYPVLSDDVPQPELYEDQWLSEQEIALSQALNQIFADAEPKKVPKTKSLRGRLMEIYHRPETAILYRRLNASLLYGALSAPKDDRSVPDVTQDIGLRRRFICLWVDSLSLESLTVASEVVIGRCVSSSTSSLGEYTLDPHTKRRSIIDFLETFLVNVEDIDSEEEQHGLDHQFRRRNKTVLRSLMMIWTLDQAKSFGISEEPLFKKSSKHKSSTSILQSLTSMLLPAVGDISKTLRHMDYVITYVQNPIDEIEYKIDNLAVDMRDGIFLTRLAEILLDQPLSAEIKVPCLGRAQKKFNVKLALDAMQQRNDIKCIIPDAIEADDMVDGHREKTMSLIWSLVSTQGLERLVNWDDLNQDHKRAHRELIAQGKLLPTRKLDEDKFSARELQLLDWTAAICTLAGIVVTNLTTSFADGKAYLAVVAAFAAFTTEDTKQNGTVDANLSARLRDLGCSDAFIRQLSGTHIAVPTRATTVANLAFLASRLLPLTRKHNAATLIQRAYRRVQTRRAMDRAQVALQKLAIDVGRPTVQDERLAAAVTLQRAWRNFLAKKARKLARDVEVFQSLARTWLVRDRLSADVVSRRVMGGW